MYRTVIVPHFKRVFKPYAKKYRHLKDELITTLKQFDPVQATHLGRGIYKVRLNSKDIPKGKSKSFRLILFVIENDQLLVPITLYFKGDQASISKQELNDQLAIVILELKTEQVNL